MFHCIQDTLFRWIDMFKSHVLVKCMTACQRTELCFKTKWIYKVFIGCQCVIDELLKGTARGCFSGHPHLLAIPEKAERGTCVKHNNVIFYHKKSEANELLCEIFILALPLANALIRAVLCLGKGSLALLQLCQQVPEAAEFDCFRNKGNLCIYPVPEGDRGWAVYSLVKETKALHSHSLTTF